mmetsp:Transcript_26391/g.105641  ORF Transcript_26391/g.105641 Transcript_26391/m.105641 type:complete len:206 (-) Transcript_26391:375-992(-)
MLGTLANDTRAFLYRSRDSEPPAPERRFACALVLARQSTMTTEAGPPSDDGDDPGVPPAAPMARTRASSEVLNAFWRPTLGCELLQIDAASRAEAHVSTGNRPSARNVAAVASTPSPIDAGATIMAGYEAHAPLSALTVESRHGGGRAVVAVAFWAGFVVVAVALAAPSPRPSSTKVKNGSPPRLLRGVVAWRRRRRTTGLPRRL